MSSPHAAHPGHYPPVPDAVDLIVEVDVMMAVFAAQRFERIDAMRRELLADAAGRGAALTDVVERGVRLELAAALRVTENAADSLIVRAESLVRRFPAMLGALSRGTITQRHAEIFADAMAGVEPQVDAAVITPAIHLAETEGAGRFRRALARLIDTVRAETLEDRHREALQRRRIHVQPSEDGMSWLTVFLPAVEAHAIFSRVTAMAKAMAADEDETRTLDQLRADVVGDLLVDGDTEGIPASARGIRASVVVTVPALSLISEHPQDGAEPAMVEGVGPVPHSRARELCAGGEGWMRILTHPETGAVLSVGRDRYLPPAELRKLVRWRADRCMAPGCGVPASRCEIDHSVAWEHGGHTALCKLHPLCRGHHRVKHHGGWVVRHLDGGTLEWTSPSGRVYRVEPERRVPVFRPSSGAEATTAPF